MALQTSSPNDTYNLLVCKICTNMGIAPNYPDSLEWDTLINILGQQGGVYSANPTDTLYSLWKKVLLNQCAPQVPGILDTKQDLMRKILINMAGTYTDSPNSTQWELAAGIVNNQAPLHHC